MRISLNKRLTKLEQDIPSQAQVEVLQDAWLEVFEEFGLPPDTPTPGHVPIIREIIEADGTSSAKLLYLSGQFVDPSPSATRQVAQDKDA
jgi:hypothetical protein